jgi:hypothetical protein
VALDGLQAVVAVEPVARTTPKHQAQAVTAAAEPVEILLAREVLQQQALRIQAVAAVVFMTTIHQAQAVQELLSFDTQSNKGEI